MTSGAFGGVEKYFTSDSTLHFKSLPTDPTALEILKALYEQNQTFDSVFDLKMLPYSAISHIPVSKITELVQEGAISMKTSGDAFAPVIGVGFANFMQYMSYYLAEIGVETGTS